MDLARGFWRVLRARRDIRCAKRLYAEDCCDEAFGLAKPAFDVLTELASRGNPHASTVLAFGAVFFAELAEAVGQPGSAHSAVLCAAGLCGEVGLRSAKLASGVESYSAWYKAWLERTGGVAAGQDQLR